MALPHRDDAERETGDKDTLSEKDMDERFTVPCAFEEAAKRLVKPAPKQPATTSSQPRRDANTVPPV